MTLRASSVVPNFNTPAGNVGAGVNYLQVLNYRRHLTPKYGGYIQAQYYFTNQWYADVIYGFDKAFGVNTQDRNFAINPTGTSQPARQPGCQQHPELHLCHQY